MRWTTTSSICIAAITARLEDERSGQRLTGVNGSLPEVVGAFEELSVDLEFANEALTGAGEQVDKAAPKRWRAAAAAEKAEAFRKGR